MGGAENQQDSVSAVGKNTGKETALGSKTWDLSVYDCVRAVCARVVCI